MLAFLIWLLMYVVPVFFTDCFVCLDEEGGGLLFYCVVLHFACMKSAIQTMSG